MVKRFYHDPHKRPEDEESTQAETGDEEEEKLIQQISFVNSKPMDPYLKLVPLKEYLHQEKEIHDMLSKKQQELADMSPKVQASKHDNEMKNWHQELLMRMKPESRGFDLISTKSESQNGSHSIKT